MSVEVRPSSFSMVHFEAGEISEIVERLLDRIGMAGHDVVVEVDETTPLARARLTSTDPIVLSVESGALEDPKRPRRLGTADTADVLGRLLLRARDRLDAGFGEPPADADLPLAHASAWDVYCVGRLSRSGYRPQRQRRLYQFRNRHGFSDAADAAFSRLWVAEGLSWADIVAISDGVTGLRPAQPA
jgi:hypothetical protein